MLFTLCAAVYADTPEIKGNLTLIQQQARVYRSQGLEQQNIGELNEAMSLYQKAIELDPAYAAAYNDLGIIYEAKGMLERAEESYDRAITVDPGYLSSYSNLALLYETKNDVDKAAYYWRKRVELGSPKDPWTKKAKERLGVLMRLSPAFKQQLMQQAVTDLDKQVAALKKIKKEQDLQKVKERLGLAKKLYSSAEYNKAAEELKVVLSIDPQEKEALSLLDKIKAKLAEQARKAREEKKKQNIQNMRSYFETGVKYYQQDNLKAAGDEFAKIKNLVASPLKK